MHSGAFASRSISRTCLDVRRYTLCIQYPTAPSIGMVAATGGVAMAIMTMEQIVSNTSNDTFNQATGRCRSTSKMS